VFFPENGDDSAAKAICGRCPVRAACLAAATARKERYGVWGGENFETRPRTGVRRGRAAPESGPGTALRALPPMDKAARLARLYEEHRTITGTALAAGMDPSTVRFYLDLLELHPDAQQRVRSGALAPSAAVVAVRSTRRVRRGHRVPRAGKAS
jgi:hypothetical protein